MNLQFEVAVLLICNGLTLTAQFVVSDGNPGETTKNRRTSPALYVDESFPANDSGIFSPFADPDAETIYNLRYYFKLYYDLNVTSNPIKWLRPHDLCKIMGWQKPKLVVDGFSRFDINQGKIGDCWALHGFNNLPKEVKYINRIIPGDQDFDDNYTGKFLFKMWHNGRWKKVEVDDRLPCETRGGKVVGLLGVSNPDQPNEFWGALLEKAYAKINGRSYEMIHVGFPTDAMVDFSGGVGNITQFTGTPKKTFKKIMKLSRRGDWIGVSREGIKEDLTNLGLVPKHIYTFTEAREIRDKQGRKHQLVRLRNPYGSKPNNGLDVEWNGAWSDNCTDWEKLDDELKAEMHRMNPRDGEFWMSAIDFEKHFNFYHTCRLFNDLYKLRTVRGSWNAAQYHSGQLQHSDDAFWRNPAYLLIAEKGEFVLSLIKHDYRQLWKLYNVSIDVFRLRTELNSSSSLSNLGRVALHKDNLSAGQVAEDMDLYVRELNIQKKFAHGIYVVVLTSTCNACPGEESENNTEPPENNTEASENSAEPPENNTEAPENNTEPTENNTEAPATSAEPFENITESSDTNNVFPADIIEPSENGPTELPETTAQPFENSTELPEANPEQPEIITEPTVVSSEPLANNTDETENIDVPPENVTEPSDSIADSENSMKAGDSTGNENSLEHDTGMERSLDRFKKSTKKKDDTSFHLEYFLRVFTTEYMMIYPLQSDDGGTA